MQKPVLIAYPNSDAACALRQLADEISEWPPSSLLGGKYQVLFRAFSRV